MNINHAVFLLVVVDNFNLLRLTFSPDKANPPLLVNPNTVLACPIADQLLEVVTRGTAQILNTNRCM